MAYKRGNPTWIKGKSPNPEGRPRGQTCLEAFRINPDRFFYYHHRWYRFCFELIRVGPGLWDGPSTAAAAARRAGYSPKSARFIACRLRRRPVIREALGELREITSSRKAVEDWLSGKSFGIGLIQSRFPYLRRSEYITEITKQIR
jgi:hypothetical protein